MLLEKREAAMVYRWGTAASFGGFVGFGTGKLRDFRDPICGRRERALPELGREREGALREAMEDGRCCFEGGRQKGEEGSFTEGPVTSEL